MSGVIRTETILDRIAARKAGEVALLRGINFPARDEPIRDFGGALRKETVALIAECKKASPSKGVLIADYDPAGLAVTYAANGASAVSVLTDQDFFQGSLEDMQAARAAIGLPVIRKDFIIDPLQIQQAWSAGADAILLIVAMLEVPLLRDLYQTAAGLGLHALVETHTAAEMETALTLDAPVIGVNNRDLHSFQVDLAVTERLAALVPPSVTLVAESGIFTTADVQRMADAGASAVLVGESVVKSGDVAGQVRELAGVRRYP